MVVTASLHICCVDELGATITKITA